MDLVTFATRVCKLLGVETMLDYVVWIYKAIRDAKAFGLGAEYVEKYLKPWLPQSVDKNDEERELEAVRVMSARNAVSGMAT